MMLSNRFCYPNHLTPHLSQSQGSSGGGLNEQPLRGIKVLLVEDTPDMRTLIVRVLKRSGAEVLDAGSAREARARLREETPDVIVSDIAMPEEDGLSLLDGIRRDEELSGHHIPAIALTAFVGHEYRHLTLRAGFEEHLCKPVAASVLITTIVNVLNSAAAGHH